jgi:23S rRNA U2552 (ribose-2'-O)-methylase RlmE/FtsJ
MGVVGDAWETRMARGKNKGGGASIKMWADYFPRAHIYGVDINAAPHPDTDRITTFVADQGDPDALRKVYEEAGSQPFDVIVDDGSHRHDHQQITFGVLFPCLRPGGLYFIEDISPANDTRRVFRSLMETGQFAKPNAVVDEEGATALVDWVHFHAPSMVTTFKLRRNLRQPLRVINTYRPDSDRLCVIRRKD